MLHLRAFQAGQRSRESQQLLNEVASARVTLLDPTRKPAYDEALQASLHSLPPAAGPPGPVESLPVAHPVEVPPEAAIHIEITSPPRPPGAPSAATRQLTQRRRKPMPRFLVVALLAAALVALGGGIAFLLSQASGFHSERAGAERWHTRSTGPV
jgi:hypothetical protein